MPLAGPSLSSAQSSGLSWHINMCFITWHPKTALQQQLEQKIVATSSYFSWEPLRPEPAHGWTCPYQAVQGTGSGENSSKLAPTSVTRYCWASQSGKCCPSASWLTEGSKEEVLLCIPSLVFWPTQMQEYTKSQWLLGSPNSPNRLILLSQRSFSKTTGKNWLCGVFEQGLIMQVHWSCCVTLKVLVLIFKTLKLLGRAHVSLQQCSQNHEIAKGTGEVYRVKSFVHNSNRVMVLSPQGLLRRRRISAFRKGKNWGSIPFSVCNTFFLCRLNGVEGDRAKKRSTKFP